MNGPYRNKKLTDAAKGQQCTLQIDSVCLGETETVVACHSPLLEDRQGTKAPDFCIAFGCVNCHAVLDRREKYPDGQRIELMTESDQRYYFHRGMVRTLASLVARGILK